MNINIKNPYVFIFKLISYIEDIDDYDLSIILRLYLKNNINLAINHNLKKMLMEELILYNKKSSLQFINKFYNFISIKYVLIKLINKLYLYHKKNKDINVILLSKKLWNLSINDQIEYIENVKLQFLAIFDCSKGGILYHHKLRNFNKNNNPSFHIIMENIKERLLLLLKLFGINLFKELNIPLIKNSDFYNKNILFYIKYFELIFQKFYKFINETLFIFENYNIISNKIINLLNPIQLTIIDICD